MYSMILYLFTRLVAVMCTVRQSGAGRPRSDLSLEKKEDLEKRLESMSGCLTNRPRKTSAPGKGIVTDRHLLT